MRGQRTISEKFKVYVFQTGMSEEILAFLRIIQENSEYTNKGPRFKTRLTNEVSNNGAFNIRIQKDTF